MTEAELVEKMKTGPEMVKEVAEQPTLDKLLDQEPPFSQEKALQIIERLRWDRAQFLANEEKRKAKAEGIDVDSEWPQKGK